MSKFDQVTMKEGNVKNEEVFISPTFVTRFPKYPYLSELFRGFLANGHFKSL